MKNILAFYLLISIFTTSCQSNSGDISPEDKDKKELNYNFTIPESENQWKFESDGKVYQGISTISNSLNAEEYLTINFDGGFPIGSISWLPMKKGTYTAGEKLGKGEGSVSGDLYFTISVPKD